MTPFLSEPAREALRRLAEDDAAGESREPLTLLRDIRSLIAELEAEPAILKSVRDARAVGTGWDEIAAAALLGPPAAKWRWQGTDVEIAARHAAGRKRATRASSVPQDLPGYSVTDAAEKLGVTVQAIYLRVTRGKLSSRTIELPDGRKYKRVFLEDDRAEPSEG
ncbi:MAG: hypothetical protein H7146_04205 [Burkholderiaceae bacterium]|nr:hypothetical protein [Microbacteriaceae bacterium]